MSDLSTSGVLYTEHADLRATTPLASLWSYETQERGSDRRPVARNRDGNDEYWLERSDPLLNTVLPGTAVSVVVNFGEPWAAGRSLATSSLWPCMSVIGPATRASILRVGTRVHAIGAVLPAIHTGSVFGLPASELVDQVVALDEVWTPGEVESLHESLASSQLRLRLSTLCRALVARANGPGERAVEHVASAFITLRRGRVSIDEIARRHGVSRKQFAGRFSTATGMTPKLFARITRFQSLVHTLLATDAAEWVSVASALGFYDQSHMVNDFRALAGSPPTVFFQPHGDTVHAGTMKVRGRPSEWVRLST